MRTLIVRSTFSKLSLIALFILFAAHIKAQDVASLTGEVSDSTGAVVAGASVILENPSTGTIFKTVTNSQGSYTFSNVSPGPGYKISFAATGFTSVVVTGIYLNVNSTRTQNGRLEVGSTAQTVEVSASSEDVTLNTTDASVGNNFQVQFLQELPVLNRDSPAALFTQQPGVTLSGAVTGARTDQNNVTLDGLDENDMATGSFEAIVGNAPVDSIQEFRGVTAGALSSAGEGGGGQFELVTKSGTNGFHGDANWYHRDTDTEANDWFNNDAGIPRSPLIRNYYGGAVGGPIKRDKAFFFFDFDGRHDTLSNLVKRTVPSTALRAGELSYRNTAGALETMSAATMASLDPAGTGYDQALLKIVTGRYPAPNDFTRGDGINSAGFDFNAPYPLSEKNYVGKVDYNLSDTQKLWGKVSFARENATQSAIQYLGDPETFPFLDKSYTWAVGHTWAIGDNKSNQAEYGEVFENYSFPNTYNPTGVNQFYFGGIPSGGTFLSAPYASAINAQNRTYPIPVIRDDFSWLKGKHNWQFGGTFKYVSPHSNTILDYNTPTVGLGGHLSALCGPATTTSPTPCGAANGAFSTRPSDISTSASARNEYDQAYTFALGRYQSVGATYNYNAQGNAVPQGTGSVENYRYYETEIYFGDTWKITPSLTISYGLRWQNYSVPYEVHGIESLPNIGFDQLFDDRIAQSKAGAMGPSTDCNSQVGAGVPCVSYILGGKANNAPGYFSPQWDNFAPRLAFAWSPVPDSKTVFNGGAGIIYDHTVVNAVQYQASQYSYLFQSAASLPFGTSGDPVTSLKSDPRFGGFTTPPAPPAAPAAIKPPFTPFVSGGVPYGLANGGAFNEGVDKNLKTPYSIQFSLGMQHQFPAGLLLKVNYVGRLGRRLLGQVDSDQLIDFPDKASGQMMSTAFANMETQWRQQVAKGTYDPTALSPQPWFEDLLPASLGANNGYGSNAGLVASYMDPLSSRGDFADMVEYLSALGWIPDNVGMGSQFSEFTYYTNKGFSSYNGMLVTLHKNLGQGLEFDLNYTWSHSIDNVSVIANAPAIGGYGFICDAQRPRSCRGNSDFDATNYVSGNFIYDLPFGHGRSFGATAPLWLNEVIGGWDLGGLPYWHTGVAYFASANAFVAGYANDAPAILTGHIADLQTHLNKDGTGTLWAYKKQESVVNDFEGPVGFQVGGRNNLRGPRYFDLDLGLGKTFPIYEDKFNLKFRCDAFNALNHPNFNLPASANSDITESSSRFGVLTTMNGTPRVLQGSLRLEF
jgi:hypothetical protein